MQNDMHQIFMRKSHRGELVKGSSVKYIYILIYKQSKSNFSFSLLMNMIFWFNEYEF